MPKIKKKFYIIGSEKIENTKDIGFLKEAADAICRSAEACASMLLDQHPNTPDDLLETSIRNSIYCLQHNFIAQTRDASKEEVLEMLDGATHFLLQRMAKTILEEAKKTNGKEIQLPNNFLN